MNTKTRLYVSERIILLRLIDILFLFTGILLCNNFLHFDYISLLKNPVSKNTITLFVYYLISAQVFQMYNLVDSASRFRTVKNLFVVTLICCTTYLYTPLLTPVLPANRIDVLIFFSCVFWSVLLWRIIYIFTISSKQFYRPVILICGNNNLLKDLIYHVDTYSRDSKMFAYVGEAPIEGVDGFIDIETDDIDEFIKNNNIRELVVCLNEFSEFKTKLLQKKLIKFYERGINIICYEDYIEKITFCVPQKNLTKDFYKYFNFSENHENRLYLLAMRCLDVFAGTIGLLVMFLFIPFVLLGNLLASRGGLFYTQKRVGEKGKVFEIVKFRSMVTTAEKDGAQWATKNDARITIFGKFLRKTRIDEIPQFWNILKGEMSLIGPRPERPEFVSELSQQIPLYTIRHVVKPGLTGWAQVMYPYASTIEQQEEKLRYDLYYIKKRGLFMDFKIVIKTINTVLYFKGQ